MLLIVAFSAGCISGGDKEYSIVDDTGREVNIVGEASKIVSLSPANTEILFALGLDDEVVGVTEFCNYPAAALEKEKVGGFSTVDVERIIELEPDVVFGEAGHEDAAEQLTNAGIPVVLFKAMSFDVLMDDIEMMGQITGKEDEAKDLVEDLEARIAAIEDQVEGISDKKTLFFMLWNDPLMSIGPNTFIDQVFTKAGALSISGDADTAWPMYDMEWLIDNDPDVILLSPHGGSGLGKDDLMSDPNYSTISAVKEGRVFVMSNEDLLLRPGPRIVDALEEIFNLIYG